MTFDGTNKYYSVVPVTDLANVPTTLRVLDAHTGAIDSVAVGAVGIGNIELDAVQNLLFATSIAGGVRLLSIDPTSGAPTTKATFANLDHALATAASYDPQTHRYFFVGGSSFPQGGSAWTSGNQIFTVDAETGHTLASPTVASTQTILNLRYAP